MNTPSESTARKPNYWFFFVPFSIASCVGIAGVVTAEILMPRNPAGIESLLAIHRSLGTMSFIWGAIAIWAWHQIRLQRR